MKLLVITKQFGTYTGATVSTLQLLKRLAISFNEVKVLTLKSNIDAPNGVTVEIAKNLFTLFKLAKTYNNTDFIGYSDDHLGFILSIEHIKYIHTYHGNWPDARYLSLTFFLKSFILVPLYKLTIKQASIVISVSLYMKNKFIHKINKNVDIIYNGVSMNISTKVKDNKIPSFLMVGNIDHRKYSEAIKIFNRLNQYVKANELTIDIYGSVVNSKLSTKLKKFKFVNLKGFKDSIDYKNYDFFLNTSSSENLPVSIMESLKNKVPVISFAVGGIPEVVSHRSGFIVQRFDRKKFVNIILNIIKNKEKLEFDPDIYNQFDWKISAQKYLEKFKLLYKLRDK